MAKMKVEYIDHMGDDARVVDAARVSFNKRKQERELTEKDINLIKYLAVHNHFTPFTHPTISLVYRVPIFVARQEFKHIVGFTRNEVSRRYVDDSPELFSPEAWRERPEESIKQGSGKAFSAEDTAGIQSIVVQAESVAKNAYFDLLDRGVAPEQARMILPQNMITEYMITGSLFAFTRMYNLRSDSHAQVETQVLAGMVQDILKPLFPVSWEALTGGANE